MRASLWPLEKSFSRYLPELINNVNMVDETKPRRKFAESIPGKSVEPKSLRWHVKASSGSKRLKDIVFALDHRLPPVRYKVSSIKLIMIVGFQRS